MPDLQTIALTDVPVTLALGVSDAERATPQGVLISVSLQIVDTPPASDRLSDTIDYDAIIGFLRDGLPAQAPFHLIETMAERVAAHALSLSARIAAVVVTVKKPSVLAAPAMVAVTLTRHAETQR